jgi:Fe-S-cluster-containing dehydrogenase component
MGYCKRQAGHLGYGRCTYRDRKASPALSGQWEVVLTNGDTVRCHTAWDEFCRGVNTYPLGRAYLSFLPFPTELCILCTPRTKKGLQPACVQHCMANVIQWGRLEDLSKELGKKSRMVLWSPR